MSATEALALAVLILAACYGWLRLHHAVIAPAVRRAMHRLARTKPPAHPN